MSAIHAFAPASVSNVTCGFDILGFALQGLGDVVSVTTTSQPGVVIESVRGDDGRLPHDSGLNTAGIAAQAVLERLDEKERGLALSIDKRMPLSSGLGSSAASSVAAAVAANRALDGELSRDELLLCAVEGETAASGAVHADNVAPCLMGGLVLVRSVSPPDVVALPIPDGFSCAILRPGIEIRTHESRALLGDSIPLRDAVTQWGNVAGVIAALYREDWELLRRSLVDVVAEPIRAAGIAGFDAVKTAALESGALGCGLSGSGPAIFALCREPRLAEEAAAAMEQAYERHVGLDSERYVSPVGARGARIVSEQELESERCAS